MEIVKMGIGPRIEVELDDLTDFQGNLKSLSQENYEKLKREILETKFRFAPHVWKDPEDGLLKLIDGHQRVRTLKQMRDVDGIGVPKVICIEIVADSYEDAKRAVLQGVSQYGELDQQGAYEFLIDSGIDPETLKVNYQLPNFNVDSFLEGYFEPKESSGKSGSSELNYDQFSEFDHKCPKCGFEYNDK